MENIYYAIRPINGKLAITMTGGIMFFNKIEDAEKKAKTYADYYKHTLPNWEVVKIKIEKI